MAATREAVEYALRYVAPCFASPALLTRSSRRPSKFPATQNVTLFFPSNNGEETSRIFFVGFKGEFSVLTVRPRSFSFANHALRFSRSCGLSFG